MSWINSYSLKPFNTFGVSAQCSEFAIVKHPTDILPLLESAKFNPIILGGGSNVLFTKNIDSSVILNRIEGISILQRTLDYVDVKIGAGVIWHELVIWAVNRGYGGIENLSLIPGCAGAAPIQNIGAYGIELKETLIGVETVSMESGEKFYFDKKECQLGYRDSIFKRELKNRHCICYIYLRLSLLPKVKTDYGAIRQELAKAGISNPGIKEVSRAIITIRRSKLPDPIEIGNAGSFFKNPIISRDEYDRLRSKFDQIPGYPLPNQKIKIPAAWLIDYNGWKGFRRGDAGVHNNHALVLVNYGNAKGKEIHQLAEEIQKSVLEGFGISLELEVNVI